MPLDPARLLAWDIPAMEQAWRPSDACAYALALGVAARAPTDARALPYVYEGLPGGLRVLPSFATVLADPGFWLSDERLGLDWRRMVHAAQSIELHRPLAPAGRVRSTSRVVGLRDRGRERGAWLVTRRELRDAATGEPLATLHMTSLLRGDGGFGATPRDIEPADAPPGAQPSTQHRPADASHDHEVPPNAALLFRLCADPNPLHADPAVAADAGFARPILHGMATYGIACHAVLAATGVEPARLRGFRARFTAPVFPGETLSVRLWLHHGGCAFEARVAERDVVALQHGAARFA
jgi:acyl dehydratase